MQIKAFVLRVQLLVLYRFIPVLLFALASLQLPAQDSTSPSRYSLLINARIGFELGVSAKDFADEYMAYTSFPTTGFSSPMSYAGAVKVQLGNWNFGLDAQYFSSGFSDNGSMSVQRPTDSIPIGTRQLTESVDLSVTPILAILEYVPFKTQFRNYVGLGAGLAMVHTVWKETSLSTIPGDTRVGGTFIDQQQSVPVFRLYTGIELGFDTGGAERQGSLIIEARYTYLANTLMAFERLRAQENLLPSPDNKEYSLGAGGISLSIGIQFSLARLRQQNVHS